LSKEPKIVRRGPGTYELRIPKAYRAVLRGLPDELRAALESGHPSLRRLFPVAYPDDPERSAEFDSMVREELLAGKRQSLEVMQATLDAKTLDSEQLAAWLSVLNDLRLFIGTSLDITEDAYDAPIDPRDPGARLLALYAYLSWLEEQAVDALAADLEEPSA
jgi:hypothetical protein